MKEAYQMNSNGYSIRAVLTAAKVPFTTEPCQGNGFWGTRFIFETRKDRNAAAKVLPEFIINRFYKRFAIEVY